MDNAVALAAIGLVGVLVTPLFKLLNNNTTALNNLAKSNKEIANETRKGNLEAAERNGHLGEQNIQITELITKHTKDMNKNFALVESKLNKQTVKEQTVEHQTVNTKE